MLKNKIYKYFFKEILKNFITILLTFTTIAWVVKAVNFLDLMVEDGYGSSIYFKYSILNITTIITRFIPLSFLLSLTVSIIKFERQKEFLILWTTGLSKIKIVNIFLVISFIITFLQLVLALFLNPFLLNKSRYLLSNTQNLQINTVLKSNDFSDTFKGITFFIDNKNDNNELENIFIKDSTGILNIVVDEFNNKKNSTIIAEKGYISDDDKLILFDGMIQTLNEKNQIKNILFKKTELSLGGISTRTIKQPKIQETSTKILLNCALGLVEDLNLKNCSKSYKNESIQNLSRRSGAPLYIPLITIVTSFLLINKKDKIYNFFRRYILFIFSFVLLVFAEIALKYTGLSNIVGVSYFVAPIIISFFFYILLIKKIMIEKK
jgi:lipopolysaccharide export system permease protein